MFYGNFKFLLKLFSQNDMFNISKNVKTSYCFSYTIYIVSLNIDNEDKIVLRSISRYLLKSSIIILIDHTIVFLSY